jgi:hypothetical protein
LYKYLKYSKLYTINTNDIDKINIRKIFIEEYSKMENKESLKLIENPNNYKGKIDLIKHILENVKIRKNKHYKKFGRLKKINTFIKAFINGLNAVSVCSIILSLSPASPIVMIIALSTTTISSVSSAVSSSIDIEGKIHSHNTSNLQYNDLYRDISARLLRNGMSSQDLDNLLGEINTRISLIEDSSLPIS